MWQAIFQNHASVFLTSSSTEPHQLCHLLAWQPTWSYRDKVTSPDSLWSRTTPISIQSTRLNIVNIISTPSRSLVPDSLFSSKSTLFPDSRHLSISGTIKKQTCCCCDCDNSPQFFAVVVKDFKTKPGHHLKDQNKWRLVHTEARYFAAQRARYYPT